jgi:hypothetical protein
LTAPDRKATFIRTTKNEKTKNKNSEETHAKNAEQG